MQIKTIDRGKILHPRKQSLHSPPPSRGRGEMTLLLGLIAMMTLPLVQAQVGFLEGIGYREQQL